MSSRPTPPPARTNQRDNAHRASVNVSGGDTDVRFGRQRIAWGTGRFFSPVDLLNPLNPLTLERKERLGVDALLVERKFGPLSQASFVYAPARAAGMGTTALRWHANASGLDYSFMIAKAAGTRVFGTDWAGQLDQAGWRAEFARFVPDAGASCQRALLGVDYAFANSLTLTGEIYFNGAGAARPASYDFAGLMAGRIQSRRSLLPGRARSAGEGSRGADDSARPLLRAADLPARVSPGR